MLKTVAEVRAALRGKRLQKSSVACVLRQGPIRTEGCKTCGGKSTSIDVFYCDSKGVEVRVGQDCLTCSIRREE